MANFSTLEALTTLCTSIPDWNIRLDSLNGQIALRQIELARLTDVQQAPSRSLKNKGSTESLRPKDSNENPFFADEHDESNGTAFNPFDTPKSNGNGNGFVRPESPTATRAAPIVTPPPPNSAPNLRTSPRSLTRKPSQPTPVPQGRTSPAALRKRKTDSIASAESQAPKYRTRSMIIVYYDSAVQIAFEDLVKFVSGSRNSMRKGKMAVKMAEMKRAAELEIGGSSDEDDDGEDDGFTFAGPPSNKLVPQMPLTPNKQDGLAALPDEEADMDGGPVIDLPKLNYVSTRNMGPRAPVRAEGHGSPFSVGLLRGYRRAGGEAPDIFDELDKGLEWCQGQCEHAAHQFLRDGDCSTEIENIKRKLAEVKERAETEIEKLRKEEVERPSKPVQPGIGRQLKMPHVRRDIAAPKGLEVDDGMEVDDDEGVDDLEPPKLIFKRSRDIGV